MTQFHQESANVLCIGGTESAGLAGLATDIRTQTQLGGHAMPIVSAVTAQGNTTHVEPVSVELLVQQLDAAVAKVSPHAIKVGLLPSLSLAQALVTWLEAKQLRALPLVFDPVLSNTPGHTLVHDDPWQILTTLLPACDLITPNADEAAILFNNLSMPDQPLSHWSEHTEQLAQHWQTHYPDTSLLLKGGHQPEAARCSDFFAGRGIDADSHHQLWISQPRLPLPYSVRGTGCTLASAIAQWLGRGFSGIDAATLGRQALHQMLDNHAVIGTDQTAIPSTPSATHSDFPIAGLPQVSQYFSPPVHAFPDCDLPSGESAPLGLYPVVDSLSWLKRLLPLGITTIQIRIKDKTGQALKDELRACIALAKQHNARLFINDFWALAIELGAYGVHLGQEDLLTADFTAIAKAGLRLGLSSHCHFEVAQAIAIHPSYLATGPVFPTNSKPMPWKNQGIDGVLHWKRLLVASGYTRPLVAIGGIQEEHVMAIRQAGADSIAVISAITQADTPEHAVQQLQQYCR